MGANIIAFTFACGLIKIVDFEIETYKNTNNPLIPKVGKNCPRAIGFCIGYKKHVPLKIVNKYIL